VIKIEHLTKTFGRARAVDDVSLHVEAGESVALWGANGAGKSTIIRCVLGLLHHKGTIRVGGLDVRCCGKAARRMIGYVPQELGFYDELRVGQAVRYFARLKGLRIADTAAVLGRAGLPGQSAKRIRDLSGGMKQRLALAIALLGDPPVLVLDEVTASLDAGGRGEFVSLLEDLGRDGKAMLFASHRPEEIQALARRVVLLDRGRIAEEVSPEALVERLSGVAMHIRIGEHDRPRAMDLLRIRGFAPRLNHVGVIVPVSVADRTGPLRVLLNEPGMAVGNFELLTQPAPGELRIGGAA
jgi:ABC-2 type transport system ATP-binding protein/nitrous oxidase accessory protein